MGGEIGIAAVFLLLVGQIQNHIAEPGQLARAQGGQGDGWNVILFQNPRALQG